MAHSAVKIAVLCNSGTVMHVRRVHVQHLQLEFTFLFCPNYRIILTADIWAFTYHNLLCSKTHSWVISVVGTERLHR